MAETTITNLPNAAALTGSERVPMDQGGTTVDATTADIAATLPDATMSTAGKMTAAQATLLETALQPGQAIPSDVECRNNSGVGLTAGAPVYIVSSSGTRPTVALADASSEATAARSLGLVVATVGNNADCMVRTHGVLTGVNTSTLTEGAAVWLSETTGQLTSTRPTQPAHGVFFGFCVKQAAGTAGILYVNVINGQELEELHDVLITGAPPATGAPRPALVRGTDGLWRDLLLTPGDVGADSAGTASSAMSAHLAAADPHAQYLTQTEGDARYPLTTDPRLSDAREWTAPIVSQTDAEAGISTVPVKWTPERWRQAAAAWWLTVTSSVGRSLAAAADQAAARTAIGAGTSDLATAGTATEIQYRNGTALGAIPGSVVNGTTGAVTLARLLLTANGAASVSPLELTGTWFTGGTATTTKPQVLIEPTGTVSTSWSTAGTGLGLNAPSGFTGNLLDLQVNGSSRASITASGRGLFVDSISAGFNTTGGVFIGGDTNVGMIRVFNSSNVLFFTNGGGSFQFSSGGVANFFLSENILEQRRGANPQSFRIFNTYTSDTIFERGFQRWASNEFRIGTEKGSGGGTARDLVLQVDGATRFRISTSNIATFSTQAITYDTGLTVAGLPATPVVGMTARVTDATSPTIGATVVGGGTANAKVWYNGANWTVTGV